MKKCLIRNEFSNFDFKDLCGVNILSGVIPVAVNFQNEEILGIEDSLSKITSLSNFCSNNSAEINLTNCIIIYDLKKTVSPDRILVCSAYDQTSDISLSNYELYISESIDSLFERNNCIIEYDNTGRWNGGENRNGCDQIYDIDDYEGRYFAIKINIPNPTDNIARISYLGLYNHELSDQLTFCEKNFGVNVLQGKTPTAKGTYTADLSCLTDGVCFNNESQISLDSDSSYTFKLDNEIIADSFFVIGSDSAIDTCQIFVSNDKDKLFDDENKINISVFPKPTAHSGISAAICMTDEPISFIYIAFCFEKGVLLDQVGISPLDATIEEVNSQ